MRRYVPLPCDKGHGSIMRHRHGLAWGVSWAETELKLGRALQQGERLVVDVYRTSGADGVRIVRTVERATRTEKDHGRIFENERELTDVDPDDAGLLIASAVGC